jgi:cyclomaltodextrin glucanotransferase
VRRSVAVSLAVFPVLGACHGGSSSTSTLPERACALTVWYQTASPADHVEVVGSWNGWSRPGTLLDPVTADGWRATKLDLAPGPYEYLLVDDGQSLVDPNVPTTAFYQGKEVSLATVPDCGTPALRVDASNGSPDGHGAIQATFLASSAGDPIDPSTLTLTLRDGTAIGPGVASVDAARGTLAIPLAGLPAGKNVISLGAKDTAGRAAEAALATVWIEPRPFDLRDMVIYQVMVDRYRDASGAPLAQPALASARAGGHLDGVRHAVESGELSAMGFNTIWLSPLYANPTGMYPGAEGKLYSAYHGYWPIASRALEPTQATEADVDALVAAAHTRGMRVLFDVVPHHVHEEHPYWQAYGSSGWFENVDGSCICGNGVCDWSSHIQDCWFTPYLPSFDWTDDAVASQVTSDVVWWLERFDGDGVRIDAVPMMPRAATRRIVAQARAEFDNPGHRTFMLGENFVGPSSYDLLRYQLGPFGLDSEFNFPLLWALRSAIAEGGEDLTALEATVRASEAAWQGSGAVMSLTIGNHDVVRFASDAAGDGGGDPWTPAVQPSNPLVYSKQAMALGVVFTLPGAPTVYYGDEVALVGHGDPDSRRVMPAPAALTPLQSGVQATVTALGAARACSGALRRGGYRTLFVDAEHFVFARELTDPSGAVIDTAVVVVQRNASAPLSVPLPGIVEGDYVDRLGGGHASLSRELTNFPPAPFSVQLYLPAGSPCS